MPREKKSGWYISIITEMVIFFVCTGLFVAQFTYVTQEKMSDVSVKKDIREFGAPIAEDIIQSIKEYPAYDWILNYWYDHWEELEIEYDAGFERDTLTYEKCLLFEERHPDLQIKYVNNVEAESLPPEDQKLYAEITYSWILSHADQVKQINGLDYLFCVLTRDYKSQFFLFSAADPGEQRGSEYEQVYTLGKVEDQLRDSQINAMKESVSGGGQFAEAGNYIDYYAFLGMAGKNAVLVGITFSVEEILEDVKNQTTRETYNALIYQLLIAVIFLAFFYSTVLRPLRLVQNNIELYMHTKDSGQVAKNLARVRTHNEIRSLADEVTEMSAELNNYVSEIAVITAQTERISADLELASKIQSNMLPNVFPPFPDRKEFNIYAVMDPAREVGGDFYDFIMIDDDHLALVIADVSGKGVSGCLLMMTSLILIQNIALQYKDPAEILALANDQICAHNPEDMFVTVWLGVLEISTGVLTFANGGHEYPAIRLAGEPFRLFKDKHGFVLGTMKGMKYRTTTLQLTPGSKVFVYTDGVPEATNKENELYGTGRMINALNRDPEADVRTILENVKEDVDGFVKDAEQFDDLTMLCLQYDGSSQEQERMTGKQNAKNSTDK